jgi:hypothetical protein
MWGTLVRGVIESMNGARFVHDQLEEHGWDVLIADATKVKGLAPLACRPTRSTDACWALEAPYRSLLANQDLLVTLAEAAAVASTLDLRRSGGPRRRDGVRRVACRIRRRAARRITDARAA